MPDWLAAIILGVVEGVSEFLPISSTGHLIIAGHIIGFDGEQAPTFNIFIQLGAILAVVFLYWDRFVHLIPTKLDISEEQGFTGLRGVLLLALSCVPALALAALGYNIIKDKLFSPTTVAIGLGVGGVVILLVEPHLPRSRLSGLDSITWRVALAIGLFQCLSLWPGVSRAAATIIGAMIVGVDRKTSAEYSFLIAVPALCGAAGYDLLKSYDILETSDILVFGIGFVVAMLSAWLAIRTFIRLLGMHTLKPFGWYRIVVAALVLIALGF